ncbi:MAG: DUF484 family protein [Alteromonadaceae bacterium]|nr:DUF484 family protein [Alteromonadaceae bacterium]
MSDKNIVTLDELPLTDEIVSAYLQDNPDFFNRNTELLSSLKINNNQRGVVSLVERQQQNLRDKVHLLEEEITQLLSVANSNEQLFSVYSDLYLQLIDSTDINGLLDCLHQTTTQLLSLADCKLWLVDEIENDHPCLIKADCSAVLTNRLSDDNFYFGRMQKSELALLFHNNEIFASSGTGSAVLVKLILADKTLGFIAISSQDADHFDPRMDTLLLGQFRQLVAKLLSRLLAA